MTLFQNQDKVERITNIWRHVPVAVDIREQFSLVENFMGWILMMHTFEDKNLVNENIYFSSS